MAESASRKAMPRALVADKNKIDTNGAAANVKSFDSLGKKGTPWHFWEDKSRLTGSSKKSLCQKP